MSFLKAHIKNIKNHPVVLGLGTGLYPLLFYYTHNFSLINSKKHILFFCFLYLLFPIVFFSSYQLLNKRISLLKQRQHQILPFFSVLFFLTFISLCIYTKPPWWVVSSICLGSVILAWFGYKHFIKLLVFQYLLVAIGLFSFLPRVYSQLQYSEGWKVQPDDIETVIFKKKPNVYYLQTDGYVNFSEIDRGFYQYNNDTIKQYLQAKGFTIYKDIRSNYTATLESNMATFVMKHHFYNNGFNFSEIMNARETIISDNPVLTVFNNNGYKTHFLAEWPYLLSNFPTMGYDYCNFKYDDISLLSEGFDQSKEIFSSLKEVLDSTATQPNFYFMEILDPGHVESRKARTLGANKEKEKYFKKLQKCNRKLVEIINFIEAKDPTALIIIMGDHGGYVGYDYMLQIRKKQDNRDYLYSAFSTQLAIKWPDEGHVVVDDSIKTAVNLFRILFSYLSEKEQYLTNLQENGSYTIIDEGAPKGIYQVIDEKGNIVFKKN